MGLAAEKRLIRNVVVDACQGVVHNRHQSQDNDGRYGQTLLDNLRLSALQGGPAQRMVSLNELSFLIWCLVLKGYLAVYGPIVYLLGTHPTLPVHRQRFHIPE